MRISLGCRGGGKSEARVGFEEFVQIGPRGTVELIERVQIDRDGFGRVLGEESVDGGAQRRFAYGFGQFIDSPLLIGDSQVGEESGEH